LLTLLAIVLSVGLVVDDAIVVVENVERHMREGMSRMNAALVGARELIGPIIAMTITLAAVYTPIALQGGLTGALFREFALTLAGAVFISGVVALTLSPMMSAHLLRAGSLHFLGRHFAPRALDVRGDSEIWDEGIGAEGGSGGDLWNHHRSGKRDHRRHDPLRGCCRKSLSGHPGHAIYVSSYVPGPGIRRNGFEAMGRSQNRDQDLPAANPGKTGRDSRHPNVSDHAVGASRR
jgi:multidrug efflux pump subunit AcrB